MGTVKMKRIVVDTNVLVSGLLYGGKPGEIVTLWERGKIRPLCSKEIVEEYLRVLAYPKFQLSESEIDFLLTYEILPYFEVITVKSGKTYVAEDPSDDKFIWCALEGNAEVIVSGDEHLLNFLPGPVTVSSVANFIRDLRKGRL